MACKTGLVTFQPTWTDLAIFTFLTASSTVSASLIPRAISTSQLLSSYDYIIAGGGTAGLTVADRLTEDPSVNVLVLEAGGWGDAESILTVSLLKRNNTIENAELWPDITSVPQINLGNATSSVAIGKVVGGGSAVNAMYNMRGSAEDYNRWEQLFETQDRNSTVSWSWYGMLPYFKKVRLIMYCWHDARRFCGSLQLNSEILRDCTSLLHHQSLLLLLTVSSMMHLTGVVHQISTLAGQSFTGRVLRLCWTL